MDEQKETPVVDNVVEKQTIKKRPKKFNNKSDEPIKVDLTVNKEKEEVQEQEVAKVDLTKPPVQEQDASAEPEITIEEVVNEEATQEETKPVEKEEAVEEVKETPTASESLPEGLDKLIEFMKQTGGSLEDYVALNRDYSELDNQSALLEYYKKTKPHLTSEEINFMMEDQFSYDEELDDEKDIKRKKLALKEQVANAKAYLDGQKSKYYNEVKAGSNLTQDQQKAVDFFNRYNKDAQEQKALADKNKQLFDEATSKVFNDFQGFDYSVGDKSYRIKVQNVDQVKEVQSDMTNFVRRFLNEDNSIKDAGGYHKALYTAMNADTLARHFYEQGKVDALKDSVEKSKNVDMAPRQSHSEVEVGGVKYKVLGDNSDTFKFKIRRGRK
jgi:hypothetical protein